MVLDRSGGVVMPVCINRNSSNMIAIMLDAVTRHISAEAFRKRSLAQGDWLFHRGDPVHSVFLVAAGCIELVRHIADGKPAILQRAGSGAMLAEASVFSDHYHCDAITTQSSLVAELSRTDFLKLVASAPAFAAEWMEYLARQVQSARLRAEILTLKTVSQRLDAWLTFNDAPLPRRGERASVAKQIGVSPEALYREIARRKNWP